MKWEEIMTKPKEQCVDCGRFLLPEELDLNGRLCNDCDSYRRAMRDEPLDEPSLSGDEESK